MLQGHVGVAGEKADGKTEGFQPLVGVAQGAAAGVGGGARFEEVDAGKVNLVGGAFGAHRLKKPNGSLGVAHPDLQNAAGQVLFGPFIQGAVASRLGKMEKIEMLQFAHQRHGNSLATRAAMRYNSASKFVCCGLALPSGKPNRRAY